MSAEEVDDRLIKVLDKATDILSKCVVPLFRDEGGRPAHFGTGFFVRAGVSNFLISAAHVLECSESLYYYIEPNVIAKLSGKIRLNRWSGDRETDPIDVGVLRLKDSEPPYPALGKSAIDISFLQSGLVPRANKTYAIIGFPATRSKVNTVSKEVLSMVYSFRNRSIPDQDYESLGFSPGSHVILSVDLRDGVDSEGQQRTFPKPQGMSGSPIFMLLDEISPRESSSFPIVAIGTKYRRTRKALIGTDVAIAVSMINEAVMSD